ncbi:MAG: hypothetical protein O9333_04060, partial [Beijerinckiaceae bacterium]|nr:hypothetical protein [Beijerinckiaceae bacterium]
MEPQASLGVGWGLGEAFRRVLMKNNMDLWLSIIGLNSHRIPELNERIIDDIFNSSRIIEEQRIEFYKFWNSYCFSFRNYFQSGNLIAFGHAENLNAPFSFIDISKWQSLDRFDFRNSTVLSSDGAGRFVGVMAFPVVDAPNAPSLLAGLKMLDVVQRFVARDPDLQLRHLEKILDGSNASTTPFDIMLSLAKPGEILAPIAGDTSRILDVLICAPGPLAPAWHPEPF